MTVLPASPTERLRVLADAMRLRILALLERGELSVGDLARSLGTSQSRVSNHLRLLREANVLRERHEGRSTLLSLAIVDDPVAARLWEALRDEVAMQPEAAADLERRERVLDERRGKDGDFFDAVAGRWDKIGTDFATGVARERALGALLPRGMVVADLGCGTGWVSRSLCGLVSRLVCVDRSARMLEVAAAKMPPLGPGVSVEYRRGELHQLPIKTDELDAAVCAMVLHHLEDLHPALGEMRRALRPGGALSIVELAPHKEAWMKEAQGDLRLGIEPRDLVEALRRAGFEDIALESPNDTYRPRRDDGARAELPLYLVRCRKPARA
jgi:ArsR family transcriptional regulator